jgi:putative DNA primase/helicase
MNRALQLLLSTHYDGVLAPAHRADLAASGLTDETIRAHYIRSVPPGMIPHLLGFDRNGIVSALLFPFRSPAGGFMDHVSLKIFPALTDRRGHTVKYLQPRATPPRLYFTEAALAAVNDDRPLWLVEGQKKALAVAQLGLPAVGFCGVEGWHVAGSRDLIPDFDSIALQARTVELVPDADAQTNPNVRRGVEGLAVALACRGARPRLVNFAAEVAV